jgi:hypothetical protein
MLVGIPVSRAAKKGDRQDRHRIPPSEMAVIGAVRGAEFESVPFFRPLRQRRSEN